MSDAYLGLDQQYDIPLEVTREKKPTKDYYCADDVQQMTSAKPTKDF